jgi:hypothetical protein
VPDAEAALRQNLNAYGLTLDQPQRALTLDANAISTFTNIHDLWPMPLRYGPLAGKDPDHDDHLQFWVPARLLKGRDASLEVEIPLDSAFPEGLISHITCNSQNVPFSITNHRLNFSIPANVRQSDALLQDCRVYFSGDVLAVVKSEEDFPQINPLYFGSPWTVRVTGE